jgi:hypothetical protein
MYAWYYLCFHGGCCLPGLVKKIFKSIFYLVLFKYQFFGCCCWLFFLIGTCMYGMIILHVGATCPRFKTFIQYFSVILCCCCWFLRKIHVCIKNAFCFFGIWRIFQFQIFLILFFSRKGICNRNTISSTFVQILAPKKWMACMVWYSFNVRCYLPKIVFPFLFFFFKSQKKQTEQRRASWWWVWEKSWCKCINKENQEKPPPKKKRGKK